MFVPNVNVYYRKERKDNKGKNFGGIIGVATTSARPPCETTQRVHVGSFKVYELERCHKNHVLRYFKLQNKLGLVGRRTPHFRNEWHVK